MQSNCSVAVDAPSIGLSGSAHSPSVFESASGSKWTSSIFEIAQRVRRLWLSLSRKKHNGCLSRTAQAYNLLSQHGRSRALWHPRRTSGRWMFYDSTMASTFGSVRWSTGTSSSLVRAIPASGRLKLSQGDLRHQITHTYFTIRRTSDSISSARANVPNSSSVCTISPGSKMRKVPRSASRARPSG
jgi:hypothetical protein